MGKLLRFLVLACVVQTAGAQVISGKGFLPDENGTNLDDPLAGKVAGNAKITPGTIIKDCAECPEMVVLPSGSFLMGAPPDPAVDPFSNEKPKSLGDRRERPQHRVQIQTFAIGKYEVTQEQWFAVMGNNPSQNKGRNLPVETVSIDDVYQFINKLNQKTGQKYRLPSEAEWEYAARAGGNTIYPFGDTDSELYVYAWFDAIANKTNPVGLKRPNQFGLFDMLGNVWEWTADCWHDNYAGAPTDGSAWPSACEDYWRVARGGSWSYGPVVFTSAYRVKNSADMRFFDHGFRLARDLSPDTAVTNRTLETTRPIAELPEPKGVASTKRTISTNYASRIQTAIRPNVTFDADADTVTVTGNPAVEIQVKLASDGTITSIIIVKTSGVKSWDAAATRALEKTERLPKDESGQVPPMLMITMRPRER